MAVPVERLMILTALVDAAVLPVDRPPVVVGTPVVVRAPVVVLVLPAGRLARRVALARIR